jgi:hypothetical protein
MYKRRYYVRFNIGSLLAGVLTAYCSKIENTPFSLNRLATQYGDYITGFF